MVGKVGRVGKPNVINRLQRNLSGKGVGTGVGKGLGTPAGRKGRLPETLPHLPHRAPPLPHFLLSGTFQHIILIYMLINCYILNLSPPSPLILLARVIAGVKNAYTPRLPCRLISARRAPSNLLCRLIRRHVPDKAIHPLRAKQVQLHRLTRQLDTVMLAVFAHPAIRR